MTEIHPLFEHIKVRTSKKKKKSKTNSKVSTSVSPNKLNLNTLTKEQFRRNITVFTGFTNLTEMSDCFKYHPNLEGLRNSQKMVCATRGRDNLLYYSVDVVNPKIILRVFKNNK